MIDELRLKTDVPLTPNQQYDYVALARCRIPSFQPMQRTAILTYCAEDYSGLDHLYAIDNAQAFVDEALDDPWFRRRFPNVQPSQSTSRASGHRGRVSVRRKSY